jgi:hypothetical protein
VAGRGDPVLLDRSRRVALEYRLIASGLPPDVARAWVSRWRAEADRRGLHRDSGFWDPALSWIREQRAAGQRRPVDFGTGH